MRIFFDNEYLNSLMLMSVQASTSATNHTLLMAADQFNKFQPMGQAVQQIIIFGS
jgi:hypothetical protein